MWIGTPFGFLMPAIRPPKTVPVGDTRTLQIRSRRSIDLDILRATYMAGKLGSTLHTPQMDYRYRAYCTPEAFAFAVARMVTEIDYTKFKPQTRRYGDHLLHEFYNRVWAVYDAAFPTPRSSTTYPSYSGAGSSTVVGTPRRPYPRPTPGRYVVDGGAAPGRQLDAPATTVNGWPAYESLYPPYRGGYSRDDSAYQPDPTTLVEPDEPDEPDELDAAVSTGDAILDDLHMRLEVLLYVIGEDEPMSHAQCGHHSDRARERCKRRQKRQDEGEVADLRKQLAERHRELAEEETTSAVAQSDSSLTVNASN